MSKLNFFYDKSRVYEVSLRALQRRKYVVTESDADTGIIKARSQSGFLKPSVALEIKISQVNEHQTTLDINSQLKKGWLTPDNYEASSEQKFINTLFRYFEKS